MAIRSAGYRSGGTNTHTLHPSVRRINKGMDTALCFVSRCFPRCHLRAFFLTLPPSPFGYSPENKKRTTPWFGLLCTKRETSVECVPFLSNEEEKRGQRVDPAGLEKCQAVFFCFLLLLLCEATFHPQRCLGWRDSPNSNKRATETSVKRVKASPVVLPTYIKIGKEGYS